MIPVPVLAAAAAVFLAAWILLAPRPRSAKGGPGAADRCLAFLDRSGRIRAALQRLLRAAGEEERRTPGSILARGVLLAAGVAALGLLLPSLRILLLGIAPLLLVAPGYDLRRRALARGGRITRDLPFAIDLVVLSLRAGVDLDAAFSRAARRLGGAPLGEEFARMLRAVRLGKPRREALTDLAGRTGVPALRTVAASINQAEETGASLGGVLAAQGDWLRRRRLDAAEETAQKAPVKMLFPLVFCILPTVFIVLVGPMLFRL